jgi:DUF1365 family protein
MSLLNQASIHFGKVIHHRHHPDNRFNYSVFYLRIPMRSRRLDTCMLSSKGVGDNRFSWISFFDKDHGDTNLHSLDWAENVLKQIERSDVDGEIWLHTFPRILGYVFNPVSFWFCHDKDKNLKVIIVEVNNTFGERHTYVLQEPNGTSLKWGHVMKADKIFHVSPFFDVVGNYQFRFMQQTSSPVNPKFVSRIDYFQDGCHTLMTSVSGSEFPLNRQSKWRAMTRFPVLTMGVILKIHWQAFKLWSKGAKFYKKPKPPKIQIS